MTRPGVGVPSICHPDRRNEAHGLCHSCYLAWRLKDPEKLARLEEQKAAWKLAHPRASQAQNLKRYHQMTLEEWDAMWEEQEGLCAICARPMGRGVHGAHVDHDHTTGKRRGLLCGTCNRGLGQLGDDPARLQAAIQYLAMHT